jgi:hypothetical protein
LRIKRQFQIEAARIVAGTIVDRRQLAAIAAALAAWRGLDGIPRRRSVPSIAATRPFARRREHCDIIVRLGKWRPGEVGRRRRAAGAAAARAARFGLATDFRQIPRLQPPGLDPAFDRPFGLAHVRPGRHDVEHGRIGGPIFERAGADELPQREGDQVDRVVALAGRRIAQALQLAVERRQNIFANRLFGVELRASDLAAYSRWRGRLFVIPIRSVSWRRDNARRISGLPCAFHGLPDMVRHGANVSASAPGSHDQALPSTRRDGGTIT